jgi:phosphonate transport system substrate-binding protein
MFRRRTLTALALASLLPDGLARAQDWKDTIKEFRVGILGGENTQDRLKSYDGFQKLLEARLGVPVKLFPSADYAGVMQGIAAGQLEAAEFGASGFAGTWLDCHCVEPVIVPQEKDGSTFYYSVMVTRKDSGITSIEEMKGHSLA